MTKTIFTNGAEITLTIEHPPHIQVCVEFLGSNEHNENSRKQNTEIFPPQQEVIIHNVPPSENLKIRWVINF